MEAAHLLEQAPASKKADKIPYMHKPLSAATSYRIMHLEPGKFSDDVWFSLVEHTEAINDNYHAISYAWDSTKLTHVIYSTDEFLRVTKNLWNALRRFRLPDQPISVWADAVCISQTDFDEKARQVQLMGVIFSKSCKVFVWLGEGLETDKMAVDWAMRTVDAFDALLDEPTHNAIQIYHFSKKAIEEAEQLGCAEGMTTLLERSWFSRAWTFQEIICARDATVSWGWLTISWDEFQNFVTGWYRTGLTSMLHSGLAKQNLVLIADCQYQRERYRDDSTGYSFVQAVNEGRARECSDPRDKIYSVLGVSREQNALPYAPNYNIEVGRLYDDFAMHVIHQTNSLDLIKYCCLEESETDRSSWAPDWMIEFNLLPLELEPRSLYRASDGRQLRIFPSLRTNELTVEGILLDKVTQLTESLNLDDPGPGNLANWNNLKVKCDRQAKLLRETLALASSSPKYPAESDYYDAWWRTFLLDQDIGQHGRATHGLGQSFDVYRKSMLSMSDDFNAGIPDEDACQTIEMERVVIPRVSNRRFCLSEEGRIGWVQIGTHVGDQVSILFGSSTPVLLRPRGDSFIVVGQCYIHGIMNGEAMTEENLSRARPICLI